MRELTTRSSYKHTLAMTEAGVVFSCGCNAQGQLGVKSSADRVLFDFIPYLQKEDVVSIAAGACHRCFNPLAFPYSFSAVFVFARVLTECRQRVPHCQRRAVHVGVQCVRTARAHAG